MKISEATFNELKETFDKAIQEAFGAGVKEGREGAQQTVDEPETKPEKVKCKADIGEKILITEAYNTEGNYRNGDIGTVKGIQSTYPKGVWVNEWTQFVYEHEYEVIIEDDETIEHEGLLLRKVDRESKTGDFVKYLGPEFDDDTQIGKLYKVFDTDRYLDDQEIIMGVYNWNISEPEFEIFEVVGPVPPAIKSPNQQRAALIQQAREFVEEHSIDLPGEFDTRDYGNKTCRDYFYKTEFFIKKNKVTAIIHQLASDKETVISKHKHIGRAICMPGDVFNADIGKAIALARALEIEIPGEFLDAVQPTHYVVGQVITFPKTDVDYKKKTYRVDSVSFTDSELTMLFDDGRKAHGGDLTGSQFDEHEHRNTLPIIDDTNAIYGESNG